MVAIAKIILLEPLLLQLSILEFLPKHLWLLTVALNELLSTQWHNY